MHIEVKSDNAYARKVTVRVPADRVRDELDRAFKRLGDRARIPGFRAGKAPRNVLDARFGDRVREDVAQALVQSAWTRAINTHKLEPISRPQVVQQTDIMSGGDFGFVISVDVRPNVTATGYTGLKVQWPAAEVSESEVDAQVDARRRSFARLAPVEGRAVKVGDTAQVEVDIREGDESLLVEPGTLIRTAGDPWLPGVEALLIGLSQGDEKEGEITIAAHARHANLAGKTVTAKVKVNAIQELVVPALSDDLAKEIGHDDVEAFRASVRDQLGKGREENARNQARANLLQALIEANAFEVPASMVEQNLQLLLEELKMQRAYAGQDPRSINFDGAAMADLRLRAAFAAKGGLLLESVARIETITVTDADIDAKIEELANTRGQNVESIRAYFAREEAREDLRERIKEEKTLDWLLDHSEVTRLEAPSAPAVTAAEPAPATKPAPAAEAAPAEEAPAPKKKSSKKAAEAAPAEAAPAEAAEAAPAEEAPKKKKAPAKKAAEAVEAAPAEAEAAPAEEAPKKKRSTKKAE
jgi:trigger factor